MADGNANAGPSAGTGKVLIPLLQTQNLGSPPKAEVDDASLQKAMDKNKESLKVKLMLRRPINQLVEQGIIPTLKTSPAFHEQRQKLERAKMGDYLKNKIQRRPDRQELIQQHILEDTTVDPSLQDKQRQLKKARLQDDLNDRLSHRPGPLELIKGNILQTDEKLAQAIKEGQIHFKRTCEGETRKHPPPRFVLEEDSGSDVALSPPDDSNDQSQSSLPSMETSETSPSTHQGSPGPVGSDSIFSSPQIPTPVTSPTRTTAQSPVVFTAISSNNASGHIQGINKETSVSSSKSRKKSKSKAQPKTRTIKFHEYKGPPNAQKNQNNSSSSAETSYDLLLQQQQLFLQWQLEWQQKYPQIILPAAQKTSGDQLQTSNTPPLVQPNTNLNQDLSRHRSKLEDMKVSDLKAELKKRNLPVSGSKPQLIERLKPYSDAGTIMPPVPSPNSISAAVPISVGGILLDAIPTSVASVSEPELLSPVSPVVTIEGSSNTLITNDNTVNVFKTPMGTPSSRPSSVVPMEVDSGSENPVSSDSLEVGDAFHGEDLMKLHQRRIEELQRELQRSQLQYQQMYTQAVVPTATYSISLPPAQAVVATTTQLPQQQTAVLGNVATTVSSNGAINNAADNKAWQKQLIQQHLQQKIQQQQLLQQQQQQQQNATAVNHLIQNNPTSAAVKANLANFIQNQLHAAQNANASSPAVSTPVSRDQKPVQSVILCQTTASSGASNKQHNALPNGITQQRTPALTNFTAVVPVTQSPPRTAIEPQYVITRQPPDYNEATKQLNKVKQQSFASNLGNSATSPKQENHKSVKSQDVDDVLEILIKNGELPPSAAQEPPTPTTPGTPKTGGTATTMPPVFPTPSPSVSSATTPHNSTNSSPLSAAPSGVVTPPPSAVLSESDPVHNGSLDFDFHLDLEDLEAMDLNVVFERENMAGSVPSTTVSQSSVPATNTVTESSQTSLAPHSEFSDFHDPSNMNMDIELSDWLDIMMPQSSMGATVPVTSSCSTIPNASQGNYEHDPLLCTNMSNSHDSFDLFSVDDMDFRTSNDLTSLTWDKEVDFAT